MSQYKLIYFKGRGRAEVSRWLFALAGVQYEDVRYGYEDGEWEKVKGTLNTPYGQLPCLSFNGQMYCQSLSIERFLAEKFGFAGKTDEEKLRADMIAHCCEDFAEAIFKATFNEDGVDAASLEMMQKKLKDTKLNTYFTNLQKILEQNKGGDGFFVGDSLTWADLVFSHYSEYVSSVGLDLNAFLSTYPKLNALREKVLHNPKIAEWIAKRPASVW